MACGLLWGAPSMVDLLPDSAGFKLLTELYWLPLEYWCEPCSEVVSVYFA